MHVLAKLHASGLKVLSQHLTVGHGFFGLQLTTTVEIEIPFQKF